MNIEKFSAALSGIVLGSAALLIVLSLPISPNYSDFIVGDIAWSAETKFQDLAALPIFALVSFLGFLTLSTGLTNLRTRHGLETSSHVTNQLLLWSVPFCTGIAGLIMNNPASSRTAITVSTLSILFIGVVSHFKTKSKNKANFDLLGPTLLTIVLISLIPFEIALLLSRAPMGLIGDIDILPFRTTSYSLLGFGFVFGIFAFIKNDSALQKHLRKLILASQVGLPFFFLTLYPARLLQPTGEFTAYPTTIYLKILIAGLVIFSGYDVIRRFLSPSKEGTWTKLFSPYSIFGLLIALKAGRTIAPFISPDDYHFGESLLGWWSYLRGNIPYLDYFPAHGLIEDDIRLFLSSVFYDGSAGSVAEAGRLAVAILGLGAFLSIYLSSGSIALAFIIVLFLDSRMTWFFLIPFIYLWFNSSLREKPAKWLAAWILTIPIIILGAPPQGLILVTASGALAARQTWEQLRSRDKRSWITLGVVMALFLLLFATTPLPLMLLGAIRYVLENGSINQIAYGVPWDLTLKSGFVLEIITKSWVILLGICVYIIHKKWRDFKNTQSLLYPAIAFFIFVLLLVPYCMGRMSSGTGSRSALVSIFCWAGLFPMLAWGLVRVDLRTLAVLVIAFMSSLLGFKDASFPNLLSASTATVSTAPLRNVTLGGPSHLGQAHVEDTHWDRITRLDTFLKSKLNPDETYLDLTSRNAHYFYTNRLPILPVTAPYNLVSPLHQKRAISGLKVPPKIALLEAENIFFDGGALSLRSPYLYRFVLDHYIPRFESGFIVGYRKSEITEVRESVITAEVKDLTDENRNNKIKRGAPAITLSDAVLVSMLREGDQVRFKNGQSRTISKVQAKVGRFWINGGSISPFEEGHPNEVDLMVSPQTYREYTASLFQRALSVPNYRKIPISWGRSEKSLGKMMTLVRSLNEFLPSQESLLGSSPPQLNLDLSSLGISGHDAGLLRFDFTCIGERFEPELRVFWWGDDRQESFEESSVTFTAENGALIVPLDASPWWFMLQRIKGMRIALGNAPACQAIRAEKIALYRRE